MNSVYWYLLLYVVLLLWVSVYFSFKNTDKDFLIAWRDRNKWQIMASKFATSVWASWFITYTWYTYLFGFSALMMIPGLVIWYGLFSYLVVPAIYKNSKKLEFYTQWDFVWNQTKNKRDKQIIDIIWILMSVIWLPVFIIGGAHVIDYIGVLSYEFALVITSLVILFYIFLSWYKAVIITDFIQTIAVLVIFAMIVWYTSTSIDIWAVLNETTGTMSFATMLWFFIYWIFSLFSLPDRYQLTFAARSKKDAQIWMFCAVIPIIIMLLFLLFIGLLMHGINSNLDSSLVFISFFFDYLPEYFLTIWVILFFAGLMSSADTLIYNITSYIAYLRSKKGDKIKIIRLLSVLLIVWVTIIAFWLRDIISITIFAAWFTLAPSIAMLYIVLWWSSSNMFRCILLWWVVWLSLGVLIVWMVPTIVLFPIVFSLLFSGAYKVKQITYR